MRALSAFKLYTIVLGVVCISGVFSHLKAQETQTDPQSTFMNTCSQANTSYRTALGNLDPSCKPDAEPSEDEEPGNVSRCGQNRSACLSFLREEISDFDYTDENSEEELTELYSDFGSRCPGVASSRYSTTSEDYKKQLERVEKLEEQKRELAENIINQMTAQQRLSQEAQAAQTRANTEIEKAERELALSMQQQQNDLNSSLREARRTILGHINEIRRLRQTEIPNARSEYQQAVQTVQRGCEDSARAEAEKLLEQWRKRAEAGRLRSGSPTSNLQTKKGFAQRGAEKEFAECKKRSRLAVENSEREYQSKIRRLETQIERLESEINNIRLETTEIRADFTQGQIAARRMLAAQMDGIRNEVMQNEKNMALQMQQQFQMSALSQQHMNILEEKLNQDSFILGTLSAEKEALRSFAGLSTSNQPNSNQIMSATGVGELRQLVGDSCCVSHEFYHSRICPQLNIQRPAAPTSSSNGDAN